MRQATLLTMMLLLVACNELPFIGTAAPSNCDRVTRDGICEALTAIPSLPGELRGGHTNFMSPHFRPITYHGSFVYVANTPAGTVDVIDVQSTSVVARILVGIDPVSVAVRPGGKELWVSNHVSDSVSVIDIDPGSAWQHTVIATIQDVDDEGVTRFDEPVGIAFADGEKAYVALSTDNQIAVVDAQTRRVARYLDLHAQNPRALAVQGDRLYVVVFESNNQTEMASGDIVRNPAVPDRDLFVFDTLTDERVDTVQGIGTMLYGIAVTDSGRVFVTNTEARNDANGLVSEGDTLADLDNRAFLNRVSMVNCGSAKCEAPVHFELEPLPPAQPDRSDALATPYAIEVSNRGSFLIASAAGSNRLFTLDMESGDVLGRIDVESVPRGIALESSRSWLLNVVENSVSLVGLDDPREPKLIRTIRLDDPTPDIVKQGRKHFHSAAASTTGTFSCESCHPDGHTDQVLWVLDTPKCEYCEQIPLRSTLSLRGLPGTFPLHWDGVPGDPFGGVNGTTSQPVAPNCDEQNPASCTRNLVDGSLATTMCAVDDCGENDVGQPGALSDSERNELATFLLTIAVPPARGRSLDNQVNEKGMTGFREFHVGFDNGEFNLACGDCHRMPFWTSTNAAEGGFDAPTWRGAYDKWLVFADGNRNQLSIVPGAADRGFPEFEMWGSANPEVNMDVVWQMVLQGSTGFPGGFARQITLNTRTAGDSVVSSRLALLNQQASAGAMALRLSGAHMVDGKVRHLVGLFDGVAQQFRTQELSNDVESPGLVLTQEQLLDMAKTGAFVGTITGVSGDKVTDLTPQPMLWTNSHIANQSGRQRFPLVESDYLRMHVRGRHIHPGAHLYINGQRVVDATVRCRAGSLPDCTDERLIVELSRLPEDGMHLLQVQNNAGLFSNELIFFAQ